MMKRLIQFLMVLALSLTATAVAISRRQAALHARELERQSARWVSERARLQTALEQALARALEDRPQPVAVHPIPMAVTAPDPSVLLNQLANLKVVPGRGRTMRPVLVRLEQLVQIGQPAIDTVSQFLFSGQDVVYASAGGKGMRNMKSLSDALSTPSLRFGLFDVLRQIGGDPAENVLLGTLSRTMIGMEVAYLTQLLEEMAPGKHQDASLAAAHNLLANVTGTDREYLFGVLRRFNDATYVTSAQAQVVQADGKVDQGALQYLQQTLGEQSLPLVAQLYQDARLTEPGSKEPLARLALAFVGTNPQAEELFHKAVLDQSLLPDQRRNLMEDLNQDGLSGSKAPTEEDLKIIASRYALTQAYLQQDYVQGDQLLVEGFREADKDLRNMLQKAADAKAGAAPQKP